ncbi:MAG: hypothetical protein L6R40_000738 [Gallowayella cf. fulva]|nr:MAG: hypothetical protein L6R40_000738 [Xanthomendoza cf. fulva]
MSLRHKFSRMWVRGSDVTSDTPDARPPGHSNHRKSSSEAVVTLSVPADTSPRPAFSPRKLHKAASTTFQAFSESLRSKAQAFYVSSGPVEAAPSASGSPGPKTPTKSSHRAAMWSSVRSRGSRSSRRDKLPEEFIFETPTKREHLPTEDLQTEESEEEYPPIEFTPIGEVPRLQTKIPDPSLQNSQEDDNGTSSAMTPSPTLGSSMQPEMSVTSSALRYEPRQPWPSPHQRLRELKLVGNVSPAVRHQPSSQDGQDPSPVEDPEIPTHQQTTLAAGQSSLRDCQELLSVKDQDITVEQEAPIVVKDQDGKSIEAANDVSVAEAQTEKGLRSSEDAGSASEAATTGTRTTDASTPRTSVSGPLMPTDAVLDGHRSFDTDRKLSGDFKGTFWPATKVLRSSKRSSTGGETPPPTMETSYDKIPRYIDSGSAYSEGQSQLRQGRECQVGESAQTTAKHEPTGLPSQMYQGDISEEPQPNMGPRAVWDNAQADRRKRHEALQADTNTDTDSDFGEELKSQSNIYQGSGLTLDAQVNLSNEAYQLPSDGATATTLGGVPATRSPEETKSKGYLEASPKSSPSTMTQQTRTVKLAVEEYQTNRDLRLALQESGVDVILVEEGEEVTNSQNFLVTSRLNPDDPFDRALLSTDYANRALRETGVSSTERATNQGDSNTGPASSAATSVPSRDVEQLVQQHVQGLVKGEISDVQDSSIGDGANTYHEVDLLSWVSDCDVGPDCSDSIGHGANTYHEVDLLSWVPDCDIGPDSSDSSEFTSRGRSKTKTSPSTSELRDNPAFRESTTGKFPRYTSTPKRCINYSGEPREVGRVYTTFYESRDRSGSPSDENWLREHYARIDDYIAGESEKYFDDQPAPLVPLVPRQRLADVSMVERRQRLEKRATYEALCQFIYRCEQQSQDEADAESLAENDDDEDYTSEKLE